MKKHTQGPSSGRTKAQRLGARWMRAHPFKPLPQANIIGVDYGIGKDYSPEIETESMEPGIQREISKSMEQKL